MNGKQAVNSSSHREICGVGFIFLPVMGNRCVNALNGLTPFLRYLFRAAKIKAFEAHFWVFEKFHFPHYKPNSKFIKGVFNQYQENVNTDVEIRMYIV